MGVLSAFNTCLIYVLVLKKRWAQRPALLHLPDLGWEAHNGHRTHEQATMALSVRLRWLLKDQVCSSIEMRRFLGAVRAGFTSTNLPLHIPSKSTARTLCFWKIRAGIVTSTKERKKKKRIKARFVLFGTLLLECNGNPAHLVLAGAHLPAVAPQDFLNRPHCCLASIKQGNARHFRFRF